eukprot:349934-Chlamydomonas_euryale.AAC.2
MAETSAVISDACLVGERPMRFGTTMRTDGRGAVLLGSGVRLSSATSSTGTRAPASDTRVLKLTPSKHAAANAAA